MQKLSAVITDPSIATPLWGAVGGLITALFRKKHTVFGVLVSILLAALFAHWFTTPLMEYFELPDSSRSGLGAILGIGSYEIARAVATGEFWHFLKSVHPSTKSK